jgi:hypothetical protein
MMNDGNPEPAPKRRPAIWRIIVAGILDFLTSFIVFGYLIAKATGNTTANGFQLDGFPAIICYALMFAYFWFGTRNLGGTLWQRILKAR